ncbi:MAG: thiopeptide-type bacteriocin biosynthesis protein [Bacteroidetes bacterium]|nr:thiopeptide-type bacteriocin biosynthesis protein [Bacteroidota bacterium]
MNKEVKRKFIIGDEWLYYKLYTGPKTADKILTEVIKPVTEKLLLDNIIDKWFFIRYADPKLHIRVRFHYKSPEKIFNITEIVKKFINPYIEDGLIWKVQADTYNREIERYGYDTIELAEDLFFRDSEMIVNMLDLIEGDEGEVVRWLFSLRAIDALLENFKYDEQQKLNLSEKLKTGFGKEFGMNKSLKRQLDMKFRKERFVINNVLNRKNDSESEMKQLFELLNKKSSDIEQIVSYLLEKNVNNKLQAPLDDLLSSYIHMTMNRIFKSKQRVHEMVIYDFLYHYYTSNIAKMKYCKVGS